MHHLRSTSASSAHTFSAVACQCVVNLLPPWGAGIKCCPCKLSAVPAEWNRRPLTLIYCPANCFLLCLAAFSLSWSYTRSLSNCDAVKCCRWTPLLRLLILACPHLSLSRPLLLYLSLPLSHTAAVLQCCSLLWLVCCNRVNSFLPGEWGCTLPFVFLSFSPSSFSLHPAMAVQSRLHLSVPVEMLRVLFKHYVGVACFHSYLMPCSVMKVDRGLLGKGHKKSVALFQT